MEFFNKIKENEAKIQTSLSLIIKIILIVSVLYAFYIHSWRILFINLLLLFLIFIPAIVRRYDIEIPREIELILLIFVVVSFLLGDLRGLVIQIFFGLAIGFVGFTIILILYKTSKLKPNYLLIFLFTLSFSLALGTISELSKYYLKYFLDYKIDIIDYNYAIISLTSVLAGALIACLSGYIYMIGKLAILKNFVQKFKTKNPNLFVERTDSPEEVLVLIKKGENDKLEFKSTLRTNLHTNQFDRKIEHSTLKTISAFLNSEGGVLLIGVSDNNTIFGIEKDNFQSNDKFNLHFTNLIKEYVGNEFLPYLHFELVLVEDKNILKVDCMKSDKPVFLKFDKIEEFYIRVGSATVQISGSKLVNYIKNNLK